MKILYVLDFFYPYSGGVPTMFLNLATEMAKRGHDVTVFTSESGSNRKFEHFQGIKIYRFGKNRISFLLSSLFHILFLREKFDVVHTSTYSSIIPAYLYTRLNKVPKVLIVHEVWPLKLWIEISKMFGVIYFLLERALLQFPFDFVICPSMFTKEELVKAGIRKDRIGVVYHAVDRKLFSPRVKRYRKEIRELLKVNDKTIVVTWTGKPVIFKGVHYLLKSIPKIVKEINNIKFVLVVSKDPKHLYNSLVKTIMSRKVLRDNTILIQPTKEHMFIAKLIGASDIIVIPSLTFSGFFAAETASIGTPMIATPVGGLPEIISNKEAAFIKLRDENELSAAIIKLAKSRSLMAKLGKGKKFKTWKEKSKEYERLYQKIIK